MYYWKVRYRGKFSAEDTHVATSTNSLDRAKRVAQQWADQQKPPVKLLTVTSFAIANDESLPPEEPKAEGKVGPGEAAAAIETAKAKLAERKTK